MGSIWCSARDYRGPRTCPSPDCWWLICTPPPAPRTAPGLLGGALAGHAVRCRGFRAARPRRRRPDKGGGRPAPARPQGATRLSRGGSRKSPTERWAGPCCWELARWLLGAGPWARAPGAQAGLERMKGEGRVLRAEGAARAQGRRPKTTRPTWGSARSGSAGQLPALPEPERVARNRGSLEARWP